MTVKNTVHPGSIYLCNRTYNAYTGTFHSNNFYIVISVSQPIIGDPGSSQDYYGQVFLLGRDGQLICTRLARFAEGDTGHKPVFQLVAES